MECYYLSEPERRGYRKRMHQIWREKGEFDISKQRIADQVKVINRRLLSKLELEEVRNRVIRKAIVEEAVNAEGKNTNRESEEEDNNTQEVSETPEHYNERRE